MPGFKLTVSLVAAAAFAIGNYLFGKKDDDDDDPIPPRDSYHSSSLYNSGAWNQTQQSYKPPQQPYRSPPSPSYSYRIPATTNVPSHSHTTTRTTTTRAPAPPDYGHGDYRPSAAYTRTPTQTQPSSRTQASRSHSSLFVNVNYPQEYEYPHTSSHVPSYVYTGNEPHLWTAPVVVSSNLRSEEPTSVEDLDYAKKLREQARRKGREMSEARSRAKSAQKKRYHGAAHAHREEAITYESAMKELDKRAAKIVFRENNKNRREGGKIDLHGLYVAEAVQFARDQVQTARLRGDEVVRFIVGKGLHSDAGEAKIRPALEDYFTKQGLDHLLDPNNAGVLIVRLD